MPRNAVIISAVFAAALGAAAVLLVLPDTGPEIVEPAARKHAKKRAPQARAEARKGKRLEARPEGRKKKGDKGLRAAARSEKGKVKRPGARKPLSPKLRDRIAQVRELRAADGDERVEMRGELRNERFERTEERMVDVADRLGWEEGTTAQVIDIMRTSHDDVSQIMEQVDRGESTWEEARPAMREAREAQAESIRQTLGDEGYEQFTAEIGGRTMRNKTPRDLRRSGTVDGRRNNRLPGPSPL